MSKQSAVTCSICSVGFPNTEKLKEHYDTLWHHKALDHETNGKADYRCLLCSVSICGIRNYEQHIKGKKHQSSIRKQIGNMNESKKAIQDANCVQAEKNSRNDFKKTQNGFNDSITDVTKSVPPKVLETKIKSNSLKNKHINNVPGKDIEKNLHKTPVANYNILNGNNRRFLNFNNHNYPNNYYRRPVNRHYMTTFPPGENEYKTPPNSKYRPYVNSPHQRVSHFSNGHVQNNFGKNFERSYEDSFTCRKQYNQNNVADKITSPATPDIQRSKYSNKLVAKEPLYDPLNSSKNEKEKNTISENHYLSYNKEDNLNKTKNINEKKNLAGKKSLKSDVNNIVPCSSKLQVWSEKLKTTSPEMHSGHRDIVSRLVNFQCSNAEKTKLKYFIAEQSKSKKKLSLPRFNLELPETNLSSNDKDQAMEEVASEAVNRFPEEVLSSLVCALGSDEDNCTNSPKGNRLMLPNLPSEEHHNNDNLTNGQIKAKRRSNSSARKPYAKKSKVVSSLESINESIAHVVHESEIEHETGVNLSTNGSTTNISEILGEENPTIHQDQLQQIKQEPDNDSWNNTENSVLRPGIDLPTLMDLFTSGMIKTESKFEDPVIDSISNLYDAALLEQYSLGVSHDNSHKVLSETANVVVNHENETQFQILSRPEKNNNPNCNNTESVQDLVNKLVQMNSEEDSLHKMAKMAESKILEFQTHLYTWKAKQKEIVQKESELREQRHTILQKLQNYVSKPLEKGNVDYSDITKQDYDIIFSKVSQDNAIVNNQEPVSVDITATTLSSVNIQERRRSCSTLVAETENISAKNVSNNKQNSDDIVVISPAECTNIDVIDLGAESSTSTEPNCNPTSENNKPKVLKKKKKESEEIIVNLKEITAHTTAVTHMKVFRGYLYTCSADTTVKRFKLADPTLVMSYGCHTRSITELCVTTVETETRLFTSCTDKYLRSFKAKDGKSQFEVFMKSSIECMCVGWKKLYLGLSTGDVCTCDFNTGEILNTFKTSKVPVSSMITAKEGALRLLCVVAEFDGIITIWDVSTNLLLRHLEGRVKTPCYMQIHDDTMYMSSSAKCLIMQEISTGKLKKVFNLTSSCTGLAICDNYILSCSYDGLVRSFSRTDLQAHVLYYGAGKETVISMTAYKNWVFTGNRKGVVAAFKFNPKKFNTCQFWFCNLKFGLKSDLLHHVLNEHANSSQRMIKCQWKSCSFMFRPDTPSELKTQHVRNHIYE